MGIELLNFLKKKKKDQPADENENGLKTVEPETVPALVYLPFARYQLCSLLAIDPIVFKASVTLLFSTAFL